ncbi:hypothetical protein C7447_101430 [Tenacibaculum adriaticum]|uniref:Lipocalin-like protein n=1 Tax=Tenacibaculum adriaticum TaxID=413713 RepID=A0A5S5DVF6_9FLAO|nr:hypothetical protein [Tenacibaculum adriaticum]TYP99825.1 hypothetical protein C7447_101430 [Tenacibaculum adriaticum]
MKVKILITILFCITLVSCSDNTSTDFNPNNLLLGSWVNAVYENETLTFERATNLMEKEYGISFLNNGIFIERTSGWCGTPPLVFNDVEGRYNTKNDLIEVKMEFFPGDFNWRIVSLTDEKLVVKRELSDQEKDHQKLIELFTEIENVSNSISCTNATEWSFTAYGSKACGGPQGYIPYSNQIDTVDFLQKIEEYTEAENQYNIKWNITSTCELPVQPQEVVCENGYPVLKY